jgi:hypothetical protein
VSTDWSNGTSPAQARAVCLVVAAADGCVAPDAAGPDEECGAGLDEHAVTAMAAVAQTAASRMRNMTTP